MLRNFGCEGLKQSPVAQSVERLPVKEDVVGSSPTGGAPDKFRKYIDVFDQYDDLSQLTVITHSASLDDVLSLIMGRADHI
jgi:hypothetical protein